MIIAIGNYIGRKNGVSKKAPVNLTLPVISGTNTIGSVLTTTNGTWSGTLPITYTYQWLRNGSIISGATSSTYTLLGADVDADMVCRVTATNVKGSANANSNTIKESTIVNFKTRVALDGGTFEAESCLITQIRTL